MFQLFGADYVKIMFSGFQNSFQTLTKEEQVPMFRLMSCHVIYCTVIAPIVQFKSTENSNIGHKSEQVLLGNAILFEITFERVNA